MTDRITGAEPSELPQSTTGVVGLADVDDVIAGHPPGLQRVNSDRGVPTLEAPARIRVEKHRPVRGWPIDDIRGSSAGNGSEVVGTQLGPRHPANESNRFEASLQKRSGQGAVAATSGAR